LLRVSNADKKTEDLHRPIGSTNDQIKQGEAVGAKVWFLLPELVKIHKVSYN